MLEEGRRRRRKENYGGGTSLTHSPHSMYQQLWNLNSHLSLLLPLLRGRPDLQLGDRASNLQPIPNSVTPPTHTHTMPSVSG